MLEKHEKIGLLLLIPGVCFVLAIMFTHPCERTDIKNKAECYVEFDKKVEARRIAKLQKKASIREDYRNIEANRDRPHERAARGVLTGIW